MQSTQQPLDPPTPGTPTANREAQTLLREPGLSPGGFTAVPNWLFTECTDLSLQAKWTFGLLLHYSWQDGQCFPGIEVLAEHMGTSRFSVMRWIGELKDYGLLAVKRRGLGQTNVYSLLDWKARRSAPDVVPMQHQEVAPVQHQEVAQPQHVDVVPVPHNIDTVVTKTQGTRGTPVDISINVDTSAPTEDRRNKRPARARKESSYSVSEIDPLDEWVQKAIGAIQSKREEDTISARTRALWADAVEMTLGNLSQGERDAYIFYLLSDGYIPSRSSPQAVADAIKADYRTWERTGRPRIKPQGFTRAPGAGQSTRVIPSAAAVMEQDLGDCCPECKKIAGARHSYDCQFAGQVVGQERKTS